MFSKNCDTHTVSYLFVAFNCRLRDNDDFDDRDEFPIFNSNHSSPEEDMAANLFVLKYCARDYIQDSVFIWVGMASKQHPLLNLLKRSSPPDYFR